MRQGDVDLPAVGRLGGATREPHCRRFASDDLDLAQAEAAAQAESLDDRLLGGETGSQVLAGTGAGGGVVALGLGEEALGQARVALQGTLEPLDLQQVDADAGGQARRSTS